MGTLRENKGSRAKDDGEALKMSTNVAGPLDFSGAGTGDMFKL
jgi:hypothetical protein